jgi:RPA family protein
MSATNREVAHRVFAAEYDDATHSYSESDEERAPNYVVTPTGARVNRVFFVGVLTEVEQVSDDVLRARVADPTGAFVVYAGQYQPDEMAFLEDAEAPLFVAVTGKASTFSPDDSDRVFTSVRPESINEVDAETRDRWTVTAAEQTLARVATARAAMDLDARGDALETALLDSGVPPSLAAGVPKAFDVYGTTEGYLAAMADVATAALEQVAGEADEVPVPDVAPDAPDDGTVDPAALAAGVDGAVVDLSEPADDGDGATAAGTAPEDDGGGSTRDDEADSAAAEPALEAAPDEDAGEASSADDTTEASPVADASADADAASADAPAADAEHDDGADGVAADASEPDEATAADDDIGDFEPASDDGEPSTSEPASDDVAPAGDPDDGGDSSEAEATGGDDDASAEDGDDARAEDAAPDDDAPADDGSALDGEQEGVLDDGERERLEEEYGTFSTGTEVEEPGEADIEPEAGPIDPDDVEAAAADEAPGDEAPADEPAPEDADADADADVDLEDAAVDAMADLDDGDGAEWEMVVAALVDDHGVDPETAEAAIQDALMAGKCYEPADERVKPI